jgi:hypothetical protein
VSAAEARQQELNDRISSMKSLASSTLKVFASDLRSGVDATEALRNALDRVADRLLEMAISGLVEQAFGGLGGTAAAPGGAGLIGRLFGFANGGYAQHRPGCRAAVRDTEGCIVDKRQLGSGERKVSDIDTLRGQSLAVRSLERRRTGRDFGAETRTRLGRSSMGCSGARRARSKDTTTRLQTRTPE